MLIFLISEVTLVLRNGFRRTFSKIPHTQYVDQTDQDAKHSGVDGDVVSLLRIPVDNLWRLLVDSITHVGVPE